MTMDFPSGEIAGLETLTIFWRSPSSILRAWAIAWPGAARTRIGAKTPRNADRADWIGDLVLPSMGKAQPVRQVGDLTKSNPIRANRRCKNRDCSSGSQSPGFAWVRVSVPDRMRHRVREDFRLFFPVLRARFFASASAVISLVLDTSFFDCWTISASFAFPRLVISRLSPV